MSDQVQFEGENTQSSFRSRTILGQPQTPKMIGFLINKGIVKSEKTAGYLLLGIITFSFLASIYLLNQKVFKGERLKNLTEEDIANFQKEFEENTLKMQR